MRVTKKQSTQEAIVLEALASADEVNKAFDRAYLQFAVKMKISPQSNKTVSDLIKDATGIQDLDAVVDTLAIENLIPFVLTKKDIIPAYPPNAVPLSAIRRDQEFAFLVNVVPKPEYELSSYDPVEITVDPFESDEEGIDEELKRFAQRYADFVRDDKLDRPIEKGDLVLITVEAFEGDTRLDGLTTPAEGRVYMTGAALMPDEFDNQILGMRIGETKSFSFQDTSRDEEGNTKKITIDCTVAALEFQKQQDPIIDDVWVKEKVSEYETLAELRAAIGEFVNQERRAAYDEYRRGVAAAKLAERFQGSIDDRVYEATRAKLLENIQQSLEMQSMTFEDFVGQNGGQQLFDMKLMMQTREYLVQGYALDALFRHEGLRVSDKDIQAVCQAMSPFNPPAAKNEMDRSGRGFALRELAERYCANVWLLEHAKITVRDISDSAASEVVSTSEVKSKDTDHSHHA